MEPAIRVENLSKAYRIGATPLGSKDLRETLTDLVTLPIKRLRYWNMKTASESEVLWALKDVSFEIPRGEVVGLIGKNGAGKSTLLKILARIVQPTSGRAEIYGRFGTILEVATGFHPELSGRENVFLSGALRGLTRREIISKFDDIIEFSEIERFIDTPVKRYSSGMYVRLAFAVATAFEPDVLLLDEVLAVGDVGFKNKCMARMEQLATQGRTVVLCSHSLNRIAKLSDQVLLIDKGEVAYFGEPDVAFNIYSRILDETERKQEPEPSSAVSIQHGISCQVQVCDENGGTPSEFHSGQPIVFHLFFDAFERKVDDALIVLTIRKGNTSICYLMTRHMMRERFSIEGRCHLKCYWEPGYLSYGTYSVDVGIKDGIKNGKRVMKLPAACEFTIGLDDSNGYDASHLKQTVIYPRGYWEMSNSQRAAG